MEIPDVYSDVANLYLNEWGATIAFLASQPHQSGITPRIDTPMQVPMEIKAVVRMSQAHAKALAITLVQSLKRFESSHGLIKLPREVAEQLGLKGDEW